jgi:hypothetical protein
VNIPEIDWRYHSDAELDADVRKILGFLKTDLTQLEKDNCTTLLDMILAEQIERKFKEYEKALAAVRGIPA